MGYSVSLSSKARSMLKKLDKHQASIIASWIESNLQGCEEPRAIGKALTGDLRDYWRYRIGSYRLIAKICDKELIIEVINVGHRRDIYQ